jgi:hypothetical protein
MFDICGKLTGQTEWCHSLILKQVDEILWTELLLNVGKVRGFMGETWIVTRNRCGARVLRICPTRASGSFGGGRLKQCQMCTRCTLRQAVQNSA